MAEQEQGNSSTIPHLPPNISIFSPKSKSTATRLLNSTLFTRLAISANTSPTSLKSALRTSTKVDETFCLSHGNAILIFDCDDSQQPASSGEDDQVEASRLQDVHHEHFRAVCLALKDGDIALDVAGCVFDVPDVVRAGFQLEALRSGDVLIVDIVSEDDDDGDSEIGSDDGVGEVDRSSSHSSSN